MTDSTTKQESLVRQAIQNLLAGNEPNGTEPGECGGLGTILDELIHAYKTSGTPGVKAVYNSLVKKNPRLGELIANGSGGPLTGVSAEITAMLSPGCSGQPPALPPVDHAQSLDDLASFINWLQVAPKVKARDRHRGAAHVIRRLLTAQDRLILDRSEGEATGTAYIIGDDGETWPLKGDLLPVRALLSRAGLNFSEPAFRWLIGDLETAAYNDGLRVELARFWTRAKGALFVSCGPTRMVKATLDGDQAQLELLTNGAGGVYFASDATLPEWTPTTDKEAIPPWKVGAFRPATVAPHEVKDYTPEIQGLLLSTWLVALVANVRPLPIVAAVGDKGGGKTHTIRAITMLTMLDDPTTVSDDARDLWTLAVRRPVVALDNVDSKPAPWLPDLLAAAVTGVSYERRKLYSDSATVQSRAGAAFAVSTRTAEFARPDVAERTLPIITGVFEDAQRASDAVLIQEVRDKRDAVLTWLVTRAVSLLDRLPTAPTLPGRFVDFGRVVWAYDKGRASEALKVLQRAQALTVGDADPLISAILEYADVLIGEQGQWEGTPSALARALGSAGADLPYLGGGKAIARMLREGSGTLALFGLSLDDRLSGNNAVFSLSRQ